MSGSRSLTNPDPSDILRDPVRKSTMRELVETAGRIVVNRQMLASVMTVLYGIIDDPG